MLALEKLAVDDQPVSEEDDSDVGLIIGIVIIVLVVIAFIVIGLVCYLKKRSKRNTITFLDTN